MKQDHKALAKAVRERREALGMSQREVVDRARRFDLECYPEKAGAYPGISTTAWSDMELGKPVARRAHTLELVDAVLRWPPGTAWAIASKSKDMPEGEPVSLRSEINGAHDDGATRVEMARALRDIAELRVEVAELADAVARLTRIVESRD